MIIGKGSKQDVVIGISTDSEQVTSLEDYDNMIKLLFGYGQKWTVILSAVNGLQNCAT